MKAVPAVPRIYHITHVDNLASIAAGGLWSDAEMISRGGPKASIGMSAIKARRLGLPVSCHPGDRVGDYVPFYFCPRSIMLYLIYRGNHPDLAYTGGQGPILHLELDLDATMAWADSEQRRWAFTLSNAGAVYCEFRSLRSQLGEIDWESVAATDFRPARVKEGKQAEFLVQSTVPFSLVRGIGVHSPEIEKRALRALVGSSYRPPIKVVPSWYY